MKTEKITFEDVKVLNNLYNEYHNSKLQFLLGHKNNDETEIIKRKMYTEINNLFKNNKLKDYLFSETIINLKAFKLLLKCHQITCIHY